MTTDTMVEVRVNKYDIKHSNFNDNPISVAVARTLDLHVEDVQTQRNSILVFDEHDQIESAWSVEDASQLSEFMDSWDLHQMGHSTELNEFTFTINKK